MNREIPFDFILDYLLPIEMEIRPFFGMFSIYSGFCELIVHRDPRIGKIKPPWKSKTAPSKLPGWRE